MYIYIYEYIYYHNIIRFFVPVNVIVRLPHPQSGDRQSQETFLAPSATSKPATMTQSAQTTIPTYQP